MALPAFFNAHTHAAMTLERGWAEDLPFERWLNERIWVAESALEEEDVYWGAALAAAEMLRAGIVGFADHYFWMDQVAQVVESSGMKANLAWCHFGLPPEQELGRKTFEDTVAFVERWDQGAGGRILASMGPHSPYMDSPAVLRRFADEAQRLGVGAHLHLSESSEQVRDSLARYGLTPVAQVASTGLFDLPRPALAGSLQRLTRARLQYPGGKRRVCGAYPQDLPKAGHADAAHPGDAPPQGQGCPGHRRPRLQQRPELDGSDAPGGSLSKRLDCRCHRLARPTASALSHPGSASALGFYLQRPPGTRAPCRLAPAGYAGPALAAAP